MKVFVCTKYGPPEVLQFREIEKPIPEDNEVLIKILATTVTAGDARMRSGKFPLMWGVGWLFARLYFGFRKPKRNNILGMELAGIIETVGTSVSLFKKGDQVFATTTGLSSGSYAEYISMPEESLSNSMFGTNVVEIKPVTMTFEEAATIPIAGITALYFLRDKANVQSGQKVLVYGASGSVGSFAVQLAKHLGANVTGVCSTANLEWVKALGADKVIDYMKQDFSKNGETYDVIFDAVAKSSYSKCKRSLKKKGYYLEVIPRLSHIIRGLLSSIKVISGGGIEKKEDLVLIREIIDSGEIKPVIDKRYPFKQIVEAHSYVDKGHKKGNVVIFF